MQTKYQTRIWIRKHPLKFVKESLSEFISDAEDGEIEILSMEGILYKTL